jgi:hypothetical protein
VTGLLDRAAGLFLAPATPEAPPVSATVPAAARAVVVGTPQDAPPLAAALALTLRAADRAPAALVAVWQPVRDDVEPVARAAATPSASGLATRLARRDLPATARGRLAWLNLPPEPAAAETALRRAAATVDGPLVTALAGPRPPELEPLIEEHDLVLVAADPSTTLAQAALAALADRCVSALACRPLPRGLPRGLALAGLVAPRLEPPLRAAPHFEPPLHVAPTEGLDR